jgi:hypothetical protein
MEMGRDSGFGRKWDARTRNLEQTRPWSVVTAGAGSAHSKISELAGQELGSSQIQCLHRTYIRQTSTVQPLAGVISIV